MNLRNLPLITASVLAVAAAACAGWFGWSWHAAARSPAAATARARDAVLQDAEQAVLNLRPGLRDRKRRQRGGHHAYDRRGDARRQRGARRIHVEVAGIDTFTS